MSKTRLASSILSRGSGRPSAPVSGITPTGTNVRTVRSWVKAGRRFARCQTQAGKKTFASTWIACARMRGLLVLEFDRGLY
jgi:hypothetical protein